MEHVSSQSIKDKVPISKIDLASFDFETMINAISLKLLLSKLYYHNEHYKLGYQLLNSCIKTCH